LKGTNHMKQKGLVVCLAALGLWFLLGSFQTAHPLKMSSTLITYSEKTKTINIELRFFCDDFQRCVNQEFNQRYNMMVYYNTAEVKQVVDRFVSANLKITLNESPLVFTCSKAVNNTDMNSFSFFYTYPGSLLQRKNSWLMENKLLLAYFPNQRNIASFNLPNLGERILQFDKDHTLEKLAY
jgi:hypothetical protein